MNGAKPAESSETPSLPLAGGSESSGKSVGPGLGKLLQGQRKEEPAATQPALNLAPAPSPESSPVPSLPWALVAADVLLAVLAFAVAISRKGRMGLWEALLCLLALGLGAWLGCTAYFMFKRRP